MNWQPVFPNEPRARSALLDRLRQEISYRKHRNLVFGQDSFNSPIWDMLLDLVSAEFEGRSTSVSSLCIAAGCPQTTALRHVKTLESKGLLCRQPDHNDGRRTYVQLTDAGRDMMYQYLEQLQSE
jgi:DNA-binding MarR family transcriptional regulator